MDFTGKQFITCFNESLEAMLGGIKIAELGKMLEMKDENGTATTAVEQQ